MSRLSDRGDVARILNVSHIIWTHVLPWCCPTLSNKGPTEKFRLRELHAVAAAGDAFFPLGTKVVNTFFRRYRDISMIVHEACAVRAEKIALAVVCRGVKELSDRKAELSFSNSPEMISARQKLFATRATMLLNAYCSACEFGSAEFYESMRSMMRSTESKDIVVDCAIWPNYMLWQNSMDVACRGDNAKVARRLLAEPIPRQEVRSFLRRAVVSDAVNIVEMILTLPNEDLDAENHAENILHARIREIMDDKGFVQDLFKDAVRHPSQERAAKLLARFMVPTEDTLERVLADILYEEDRTSYAIARWIVEEFDLTADMLTRATKRAGHLMGPENKPSETKGVLRWISDLCYTRSIDLKQSDSILPSGPVKTCTTDQGEFPTLPWTSEMRDDRMRRLDDWPIPLHTSHTPIHLPVDATEDLWSPGINFGVPLRTMEFVFEPIIYEEPPLPPPARNQPRQPDPPPLANRSARRQQPPSRGNQQPRPTKHKKGHR